MEVGRLSCQVTLLRPPGGADAQGEPVGTWAAVTSTWADIKHLSGLQALRGGADASLVKASARLRWRADVAAGWRVQWGAALYNVTAVLPDKRRQYVDLVCELVA